MVNADNMYPQRKQLNLLQSTLAESVALLTERRDGSGPLRLGEVDAVRHDAKDIRMDLVAPVLQYTLGGHYDLE